MGAILGGLADDSRLASVLPSDGEARSGAAGSTVRYGV
jgi:hypothetical protein